MEQNNPFSLLGKTVFVTGASSGIGRAIAVECSKMGAQMVITGRNEARLNETFVSLAGENHVQLTADLSVEQDIDSLVSSLPKLDSCVNNAGIIRPKLLQFSEKKDILEMFETNTFSSFLLVQKLIQSKKLNKNASIVFINSISGVYCSAAGEALYSASKGAINGYLKGLALEMANRGIRVNSVNPGVIETNLFNSTSMPPEELEGTKKKYPLKRFGKPEEVAYAAVYLLSDASQWVTGSNLVIDGGYTLN
jgi:NAD(P)-dependent dehydrogenase (short-subunit alcohol dehydrogenase family)